MCCLRAISCAAAAAAALGLVVASKDAAGKKDDHSICLGIFIELGGFSCTSIHKQNTCYVSTLQCILENVKQSAISQTEVMN